jgi:hypothetical protein
MLQDVPFGLRRLVDIANRALSPAAEPPGRNYAYTNAGPAATIVPTIFVGNQKARSWTGEGALRGRWR